METTTEKRDEGLVGFILLWILLTLQTGVFSILIIDQCEIKAIRIFTAFVGIGLAVFPIFVRKTFIEANNASTKSEESLSTLQRVRKQLNPYLFGIMMFASILLPWVSWLFVRNDGVGLLESVIPSAIMQLAAGAIAYAVSGVMIMVKEGKSKSWQFNLFRLILIVPTLFYGLYIAAPGILIFIHWVLYKFHSTSTLMIVWLQTDNFWLETARTIGTDAWSWFLSFAFLCWTNIQIYKNAFIKNEEPN